MVSRGHGVSDRAVVWLTIKLQACGKRQCSVLADNQQQACTISCRHGVSGRAVSRLTIKSPSEKKKAVSKMA